MKTLACLATGKMTAMLRMMAAIKQPERRKRPTPCDGRGRGSYSRGGHRGGRSGRGLVVEADSHGTHKALMNPAGTTKKAIDKEATNAISHTRKHTYELCSNKCSNDLLPIQQQNWQTCARK